MKPRFISDIHLSEDSSHLTNVFKAFLEESKEISVKKASSINTQKLAQQFPQGITEKIYERKDSNGDVTELTIVRIVVSGNKGSEYKKVKSKYGVSYFKNGGIISQFIWDTETN